MRAPLFFQCCGFVRSPSRTDYIDLYQIHRNDHATPWEETLEALSDLVKAGKVRYLGASSMHGWEFAKALHLQQQHGWARFVSMQDHYNLLAREEEREMLPLCQDEGVGTIVWSPLARGRLARAWYDVRSTPRSASDGAFADTLYSAEQDMANKAIVDAVGQVAEVHGASRAQIALAWLRRHPVVTAPLVGAGSTGQIDDAVASLDVDLTDDDARVLAAAYTPRHDWQGILRRGGAGGDPAAHPRHGPVTRHGDADDPVLADVADSPAA